MFKVIDLFAGIGGFSLGLEATGAFQTIAFCEQDKFCQAVLKKHWPGIPIHPDVKTFAFQGECDVITGGYPCTPFSVAGKQKGFEDDRHLWPAMFEIVAQKKPSWVICENVYGHISMGVDTVLLDLASENYTCLPFVAGACAVNAPHRRQRIFVIARKDVADTSSQRARSDDKRLWTWVGRVSGGQGTGGEDVGNAQHDGFSSSKKSRRLLDKSKEQKGQKEIGKSQGASGSSKDVADPDHTRNRTSRYATVQDGQKIDERREEQPQPQLGRLGQNVADTSSARSKIGLPEQNQGKKGNAEKPDDRSDRQHRWPQSDNGSTQQCLGLPPDGLSRWVAGYWEQGVPRVIEKEEGRKMKLQALGNAVVPQIVEQIGLAIIQAEKDA